ncbi:MAG TPA: MOSC N-terminal beta barrel domain-containing protein [Opitutaceae bacterium]|nr:MOSC N-terminal beta barrel domain-containing protein [Opitutaceae bacterium]
MQLTGIFVYPVKSLGGFGVTTRAVDSLGLADDRRFMVVDADGRAVTQRNVPRMALVSTEINSTTLELSAPGAGSIEVSRSSVSPSATARRVSVWRSEGLVADDCGDEPASWLGNFLQVSCRLVQIGRQFDRPVLDPRALPTDRVSFADAHPFLVISEASLADLNARLVNQDKAALPMNRFRPNLVVSGCAAFAEDGWTRFKIGELIFRSAGPCSRCVITTTDQATAEVGKEPLRTLATYRRDAAEPTNVNFGMNLIHETKSGTLRVGDNVELL